MMRDFSLRRIVQNWDDSFENKKKRKWNERKHKEEKTNNARRILKLFSSSGSSSGSLLFLGGVYRGHLIRSCYSRARFCALLLRWCFLGDFLKKKSNGQKQTKTLNHSILLSFRVGCPLVFFQWDTHTHLFYLTWLTRFNAQTINNNDRGRVLRVSQLGSPFVFQPGDGVGSDRWDVVDTHARHGRKRWERLSFV